MKLPVIKIMEPNTMDPFAYLRIDDLTPEEERTLRDYKAATPGADGTFACFTMNRLLEHGLFPDEMGTRGTEVVVLDQIFARCTPIVKPITVFRAIGARSNLPLNKAGARFRNRGFWSTSHSASAADNFLKSESQKGHGAFLTLELPVGLPAFNMASMEAQDGDHEGELLLPRGVLWTIKTPQTQTTRSMLPGVSKYFESVVDVTLEASPNVRVQA